MIARALFLVSLVIAIVACSSAKPPADAAPADTGAPDSGSNCVPPGGSCKTDAGDFNVSLCCSGRCELGSVSTGMCD